MCAKVEHLRQLLTAGKSTGLNTPDLNRSFRLTSYLPEMKHRSDEASHEICENEKKTKVPNTFRFSVDDTRGSQATSTSSPLLLIYPISVDLEFLYKNTRISATSYWNISSRYDASSYYKSCIMQIITIFEIQYEIA